MQVFANLIDNALKYSDREDTITISATQTSGDTTVSVADTGIGIDAQNLELIFERLYRVDKSRTEGGQGLGLSIVKAIVEAHNGKIEVTSRKGSGSIFSITLPGKKYAS